MELSSISFNQAPYRELGTNPRPDLSTKVLNWSLVNMLFHPGAVTSSLCSLTPLQVITVAMLMQIRYVGVIWFGFIFSNLAPI